MNKELVTNEQSNKSCSMHHCGAAVGFVVIVAGIVWLLSKLGMIDIPGIGVMWPSILIAVGFIKLFRRPVSFANFVVALVMMVVGALLQLSKLNIISLDIHMIWPFLIILAGVLIIWMSVFHKNHHSKVTLSENQIDKYIVFGGDEFLCNTKKFEGGIITAVFGGAVADLRNADIETSPAVLEISVVFGGAELRVPDNWRVVVQGAPVLGGFENKARLRDGLEDDKIKTLVIKGSAIFGGVEIKN